MVAKGRPRVFDVEEAVEAAMNLFWERGYEGASLAELKDVAVDAQTDPNRPRGCMLALNGSIGGTGLPEAAKEFIVSRRAADRARVRGCVERAVASAVLKPDTDVEAFTAALHGFVLGIAPQARDGLDAAQLHRSAEVLLMAWDAAATQK
ncbi:TetR family transcriptional regulator C-terminal domain-containing protein [Arthrobacter sp. ISL-30]|uniref:TetR family transcriptional regulator C-terminal domain-containing protein n=1 Tax=Arthrobacter sp. ISL-30 TaxID=2819109 RepID=UPI001BE5F48A|nr:hypothetical protein [Arthrobacter sp. ISL-30]MBT2515519.1 hypothetical protein [Arthrobacter sp. ISL-30]